MLAKFRFWTAIAIIGICAFSVVRGVSVVRFSLANAGSSENVVQAVHAWRTVPGIASAALQSELVGKLDPSDLTLVNRRREALTAILAIEPLHSTEWLSLSGTQLITDQPMDLVFGSLRLSTMTGPNEGYLMTGRGIFSASLWEGLSPELKRRAASDLAWGDPDSKKLGGVLATKSARVRNELLAAILATGISPKEVERRLGF